jgi:hypothetical protein
MRIKDGKGKKAELVFLISAGILTLALIAYVLWLVQTLVVKSNSVFKIDLKSSEGVPTFDFAGYEKLLGPIPPAATSSVVGVASSTVAKATSTKE